MPRRSTACHILFRHSCSDVLYYLPVSLAVVAVSRRRRYQFQALRPVVIAGNHGAKESLANSDLVVPGRLHSRLRVWPPRGECQCARSSPLPDRSYIRKNSSAFLREQLLLVSQRRATDRRFEPRDFQDGSFTRQRSSYDEAGSRQAQCGSNAARENASPQAGRGNGGYSVAFPSTGRGAGEA